MLRRRVYQAKAKETTVVILAGCLPLLCPGQAKPASKKRRTSPLILLSILPGVYWSGGCRVGAIYCRIIGKVRAGGHAVRCRGFGRSSIRGAVGSILQRHVLISTIDYSCYQNRGILTAVIPSRWMDAFWTLPKVTRMRRCLQPPATSKLPAPRRRIGVVGRGPHIKV